MNETPDRTESLFAAAVALPAEARAGYLDEACAEDRELRTRLDALLRAHDRAGHLLDQPVPGGPPRTGAYVPSEQPGAVIAGRYKLLEQIGEGGMGTVWVAEQTEPVRRKVALKLIKVGMDSKSVLARFEAERQALAVMDHPNIAKVLDGGLTEPGRPFFVMEYVKGVPITEYCDATRLSVPERLNLFVQVCHAVQHAHQKGIIHRDLKPSNILVAPYDDKPVPKVIDFGLAKAMHQSLTDRTLHTAHETVLGTPLYMSPEQAQLNNLDVDTRSDIYSLGVLLYELLTGTTPVEKQRLKKAAWDEVKRIIREEDPPRPSTRLTSASTLPTLAAGRQTEPARLTKLVRGELDWIVMKSLEKDRSRRYETANGFALDVQRYLAGDPVLAAPPSASYRLRKFVRRHRGQVVAASVVFVALLVGIAGMTWGLIRADQERRIAQDAAAAELKAATEAREQKARAEAAEQRAKDEAHAVKAVSDFLQNGLLRQASTLYQAEMMPLSGKEGEFKFNPTIRELLDRAAAELAPDKIDARFPNLPYVQAEALKAVGDAYVQLAPSKAVDALTRAIELYQKSRGPDDRSTLGARHALGMALGRAADRAPQKGAEAVRVLQAVLDDRVRILGPNDPDTFATRNELGLAILFHDGPARAIPYLKKVQDDARRALDPKNLQIAFATFNLGFAYERAKQTKDAVREYEALYAVGKRFTARADHPYYQAVVHALGMAYRADGNHAKAIPLLEEALTWHEKQLGPNHIAVWSVRHALGWSYLSDGRQADGIKAFEANFVITPKDMVTMEALGWAVRLSDIDRSIALHSKAHAMRVEKHGPDAPEALHVANKLANLYRAARRSNEAIVLLENAVKQLAADAQPMWLARHELGWAYEEANRRTDAIATFEQNLKNARPPNVVVSMAALAQLYHKSGRTAEAITLYEKVRELRTKRKGQDAPETVETIRRLAETYHAAGRSDEAIELLEDTVKRLKSANGPDDPEVLKTTQILGNTLSFVKREEAFPLLEEVIRRSRATRGEADPLTLSAMGSLRTAYALIDRFDKAVEVAAECVAVRRKHNLQGVALAADLGRLGYHQIRAGKPAEAEPVLREALELWTKADSKSWYAATTRANLGLALHQQKKHAEAEPVLLAAYKEMTERAAVMPTWDREMLSVTATALVELYTALGKLDEALRWRKEENGVSATATPPEKK